MKRALTVAIVASFALASACAGEDRTSRTVPGAPRTLAWEPLAEMPTPRTEVTGAAARGKIYVIGGFSEEGGTVATVEIYDVAAGSWTAGPDLPIAVNHAMATARRGKIYVVGGYRGPGIAKPTRRAFVLRSGGWKSLPRMPFPVAAGGAVTLGDRIYVLGGVKRVDRQDGHELAPRTLVYNPSTRKWKKRPAPRVKRQHLGAAASSGRAYLVGGRLHGFNNNLDATERYVPRKKKWVRLPELPTARGGLAATATNSGLVVAAGGEEAQGTFSEVEALDVTSLEWTSLPDLPTPRHGLALVAIGDRVFAIGGGPEPGLTFSGANEMLDLGP